MSFRKAYEGPFSVPAKIVGESLTKQSEKDSCDVNKILSSYRRSGTIANVNLKQPQYGDLAVSDFHDAMNTVLAAQDSFYNLPSAVRKRFGHSIPDFLDFVANVENRDEAIKLGLLPPTVKQEVPPAAVVPPVEVPPVGQA